MKHVHMFSKGIRFPVSAVLGLCLLVAASATLLHAQFVSEWNIPGTPNIQGLDALLPENPFNFVYFTEYDKARIGLLSNITGGTAVLSEWLPPAALDAFHPFKIVAGKWNFYNKKDPTVVTVPPFLNPPTDIKPKDLLTFVSIGFRLWSIATFTLPDEGAIGMLMGAPYGPGPDYFWIWKTPAGLGIHPWDIQRRSISSDETSAWFSNREPQDALYQFFPTAPALFKWDFSKCLLEVHVFYVTPASNVKDGTEIWIGGVHSDAAGLVKDCIARLIVDKKNTVGVLRIWDLPPGQARTMTSILFTHRPDPKGGFTRSQVWLSSSSVPEMTLLEPNSLYQRKGVDSVCVVNVPVYNSPNGLFWDDPVYTASLAASDDSRRIWVTSGQSTDQVSFLSANMGNASEAITSVTCEASPGRMDISREIIKAERLEQQLADSNNVASRNDTVPCSISRVIWDPTTGFGADFKGAFLDIDMAGKATPVAGSNNAFSYSILWHEPTKGRIGMLWSTPALSYTVYDNTFGGDAAASADGPAEPLEFKMSQNYPNPFNPRTSIDFTLPEDARVTLKVYNTLGQEVATLVDGEVRSAGEQSVDFSPGSLPSGVYFYRIRAERVSTDDTKGTSSPAVLVDVKKMMYLK